jgi:hypothetical protein
VPSSLLLRKRNIDVIDEWLVDYCMMAGTVKHEQRFLSRRHRELERTGGGTRMKSSGKRQNQQEVRTRDAFCPQLVLRMEMLTEL